MGRFLVNSVQETTVPVPAKLANGTPVTAQVAALVVELVSLDEFGGTLTHRDMVPTKEERDAALVVFERGAVIETTFRKVRTAKERAEDLAKAEAANVAKAS